MKPALVLTALFGLLLGGQCFGQESTRATLHVTSVRKEEAKDWCTTGKCNATRHTVEGYINAKDDPSSVEYVLECVEVMATEPTPHYTIVCDHVHAHTDYLVKVGATFVAFEHEKASSGTTTTFAAYGIKSEKEVAKQKTK